jgi:hypothetical protein
VIGLHFERHRHGSGPEHYAAQTGDSVFEIYPKRSENETTTTVRFGFTVPAVDQAVNDSANSRPKCSAKRTIHDGDDEKLSKLLRAQGRDPGTAASISDGALHEAVAGASDFAPRDGYLASFSPTLDKCALWKLSRSWNVALSAHETGRSAGLDLAVIRFCGTQQTIYFSAGNHDPPALSNRFDCAPVELAVSPGLMFPKQGCKFSRRIRYTVVERRLLMQFVVLFHATQYSSASAGGCSIRDAIRSLQKTV